MGQYCFAGCCLPSLSVTLPTGGSAGRRERENTVCERWARPAAGRMGIGRPTLHGEPVVLRPVRVTPCYYSRVWLTELLYLALFDPLMSCVPKTLQENL